MKNFKEILYTIDTLIFDVDGVLTDGSLIVNTDGELLRKMNVKDGYALKAAIESGLNLAIISGGTNEGVRERLRILVTKHIYLGAHNKVNQLNEYIKSTSSDLNKIMYMGDDIPDIPVMKLVGLPCCPQDAANEVKKVCNYVSDKNGGNGAVRDIIEQIMKIKKTWNNFNSAKID